MGHSTNPSVFGAKQVSPSNAPNALLDKIEFLSSVIPEMYWMTFKAKRKIANSFKEKVY
jgi:hypothetical protein